MKEEVVNSIEYPNIKPDNIFEILYAKNNIDILCIKAKNAYSNYDILRAYDLCIKYIINKLIILIILKRAIQDDPLYFDIIPIYCSCLLEFNYIGELYSCAHNLVENHSNHPLAWYSVVINL